MNVGAQNQNEGCDRYKCLPCIFDQSKQSTRKIRTRWLKNQFTLVTSSQIEREYIDVLYHLSLLKLNAVDDLLLEIAIRSDFIPIKEILRVCKDPDDDIFLETAVTANADFLVTKNLKHFPKKSYSGVKSVKVSKFLKELEKIWP